MVSVPPLAQAAACTDVAAAMLLNRIDADRKTRNGLMSDPPGFEIVLAAQAFQNMHTDRSGHRNERTVELAVRKAARRDDHSGLAGIRGAEARCEQRGRRGAVHLIEAAQ